MHGATHHVDGADVAIVATSKQLVRVSVDALCARAVDGDVLHVDREQQEAQRGNRCVVLKQADAEGL